MVEPTGRQAEAGCHVFPVRVYWEDTDASGIVYHASYLRYAERARSEALRAAGIEQWGLLAETGVAITVRRCTIDFRAAAKLDDALAVETRITHIAGASFRAEQAIRRDGAVLVHLTLQLACINRAGRATRLPERVRAIIAALLRHPRIDSLSPAGAVLSALPISSET